MEEANSKATYSILPSIVWKKLLVIYIDSIQVLIFILYRFFQIQEIPLNTRDFNYNFLEIQRLLNYFLLCLFFPFSIA